MTVSSFTDKDIVSVPSRETADDALLYWTDDRMRSAIPIEPIDTAPSDSRDTIPDGPAEFSKGNRALLGTQEKVMAGDPTEVSDYKSWPYLVVGKVFFTRNKKNYVCSGSQIQSNTILTAGHCVNNKTEGGWSTNFIFCPNYPFGTCVSARWLYAWNSWTNSMQWPYDYAMCTFGGKQTFFSWSGTGWNQPITKSTQLEALGYPAAAPYDGQKMYQVTSTAVVPETISVGGTMELANTMTGGCSGGPWWNLNLGMGPYANGLNSFKKFGKPQFMYSPYFDSSFKTLFFYVTGIQFNP